MEHDHDHRINPGEIRELSLAELDLVSGRGVAEKAAHIAGDLCLFTVGLVSGLVHAAIGTTGGAH